MEEDDNWSEFLEEVDRGYEEGQKEIADTIDRMDKRRRRWNFIVNEAKQIKVDATVEAERKGLSDQEKLDIVTAKVVYHIIERFEHLALVDEFIDGFLRTGKATVGKNNE